jgi:hypothetical protein
MKTFQPKHVCDALVWECCSLGSEGYGISNFCGDNSDLSLTLVYIDSSNPMGALFRAGSTDIVFGYYDGTLDAESDLLLGEALRQLILLEPVGATIGTLRSKGQIEDDFLLLLGQK